MGIVNGKVHLSLRVTQLDSNQMENTYWWVLAGLTIGTARALAGNGGPLPFPLVFPWHAAAAAERVPFHLFWMALDFWDAVLTHPFFHWDSSISSTGNRCHDYKLLVEVGKYATCIITTCCQKKRQFASFGDKHGVSYQDDCRSSIHSSVSSPEDKSPPLKWGKKQIVAHVWNMLIFWRIFRLDEAMHNFRNTWDWQSPMISPQVGLKLLNKSISMARPPSPWLWPLHQHQPAIHSTTCHLVSASQCLVF